MQTEQRLFDPAHGWRVHAGGLGALLPQVVLVLGARAALAQPSLLSSLRTTYPAGRFVLASTAGQIADTRVTDEPVTATALAFEATRIGFATTLVRSQFESRTAGGLLAERLRGPDLVHVLVVSDGQLVNGTELARGFNEKLGDTITVTGGLAGDGVAFEQTVVGLDAAAEPGRIVALGLYSRHLRVGLGSCGGWTPAAGTERTVTAAEGNILFSLDGQPALELYSSYLGVQAAGLPAAALRCPLHVTPPDGGAPIVRSILGAEPSTHSLVFAGDVPTGSRVRFMRATSEDLIGGAALAAAAAAQPGAALAVCISCVGRRLVLGERTGEELVAVRTALGPEPLLAGFYSYGELAPAAAGHGCQLHNQTMTITTFAET